jgi:hypothetical protein
MLFLISENNPKNISTAHIACLETFYNASEVYMRSKETYIAKSESAGNKTRVTMDTPMSSILDGFHHSLEVLVRCLHHIHLRKGSKTNPYEHLRAQGRPYCWKSIAKCDFEIVT